jgi:hypothetical protein
MESDSMQATIDEMQRYIQRKIAAGFYSPEDIPGFAVETFSDQQTPEVLRPIAERLTREAVAAHLGAQEQWPVVTDCDLLDRTFGELDRAGIVARQDFTCCQT